MLILTSSVAYQDGQAGQTSYAASKGGVASLVLPLARDLARFGIRANAIAPSLFKVRGRAAGLADALADRHVRSNTAESARGPAPGDRVPAATGRGGRIRAFGPCADREPDAQRHGHSYRWRDADGQAVIGRCALRWPIARPAEDCVSPWWVCCYDRSASLRYAGARVTRLPSTIDGSK